METSLVYHKSINSCFHHVTWAAFPNNKACNYQVEINHLHVAIATKIVYHAYVRS